jgi:BRO family protein
MPEMQRSPHRRSLFDDLCHREDDGTEWWSARELQEPLGYERWERFEDAIERAKTSCRNLGAQTNDHFRGAAKMVEVGSGAVRSIDDVQLTRYGAYLVAMNGDPRKREIAAAQGYFAVQTYRAETQLPPIPVPLAKPANESEYSRQLRPWGERLSRTIQEHRLHVVQNFDAGSFSTYTATMGEILMIEDELLRHQLPLKFGDLPDGSMGQRWSRHRKETGLLDPLGYAPLEMPHIKYGSGSLSVPVLVYPAELRPTFEMWLNGTYIPEKMPDYFAHKPEWKSHRLAAASAADRSSLRLTGIQAELSDKTRRALEAAGGFAPAQLPKPSE